MRHLQLVPASAVSPAFSCESRTIDPEATWIVLGGELDLAGVPQLRQHLYAAICTTRLIALDLRGLTFLDTAGAHTILDATIRATENRTRLVLLRGPVHVDAVFAYTNTLDRVEFVDLYATDHPVVRTLQRARTRTPISASGTDRGPA